jgi:hypothetical protein
MSQWSLYFRLSKQIRWGGGLPSERLAQLTAEAAPLAGSLDGEVHIRAMAGAEPAPGVAVSLDGRRTVTTSANGHYHFADVPEGAHEVGLAISELPADVDAGQPAKRQVAVHARRVERTDFDVLPLVSIPGKVAGPENSLEGILIRLEPGNRYTTTAADGHFAFYNVHEGDYQAVLDAATLPENGHLRSVGTVAVMARLGAPMPTLEFSFEVTAAAKPIRKVLDKQ